MNELVFIMCLLYIYYIVICFRKKESYILK